jgi:aspartyl-tRNA(Asn)/glutamyl-tRNA(Gln) amidotransferase subunit B
VSDFETVIGLEVHAQLRTQSKLFSTAPAHFVAEPNRHVDAVTMALPGTLPVLNRQALEFAARLGFAVQASVRAQSVFARKNYFYPDLPKNYQISQYELPICSGGAIEFRIDGQTRRVALERIHLEEDAGKSVHERGRTLIDLNRAGVPLVEIVSRPELRTPREAGFYLAALRQLVRYLGICDGNMEEGSLRCDANISLRRPGSAELGTRVEIKNLNSMRFVVAALEYEERRQAQLLDAGQKVEQQTRSYDPDSGVTKFLRGKEDAQDYRYFPDPDLPPVRLSKAWLDGIAAALPELPLRRLQRLLDQDIPGADAEILSESRELADYSDALIRASGDARSATNWITGEVLRACNARKLAIEQFPIAPARLAELLALVREDAISLRSAKEIFERMLDDPSSPRDLVEREGLGQIQDDAALREAIEALVEAHPAQLAQYLSGKTTIAGFFVGQLMRATGGRAHPQLAQRLVSEALEQRRPR